MTFPAADPFDDLHYRRRKRLPQWIGPAILGLIVLGVIALFVLRGPQIGTRANEQKVISVVLPPPPPPPPPPPAEPKPPEPRPVVSPPTPSPETPPPPTQTPPQAAPDTSALTARTGAGPSNYGLAQGNGGGTRIGGAPANDGRVVYGNLVLSEMERAVHSDPALSHNAFTVQITATIGPDGAIQSVQLDKGVNDPKFNAALQRRLASLTISQRPPAGFTSVRLELNARPSS